MKAVEGKLTFFKQSGWMLGAGLLAGVFMYATHITAQKMPKSEYGVFTALLQVLNLLAIPALGLQNVVVQQTAGAVTEDQKRILHGTIRALLGWTFILWLVLAGVALLFQGHFLAALQIGNPAAFWVTLLLALACLWSPIANGLLQGQQNFLWLGFMSISSGVGRFISVTVVVLWLGGEAAGAVTGALIGMLVAMAIGGWQGRSVFVGPDLPMVWRPWFEQVIPLTLGLGCSQFMMSADMVVVQGVFPRDQTGFYAAAGMIGRALVTFTGPMMIVMFPKIVRSAADSKTTNVMAQALGATVLLGGLAAAGCTLFPRLPLMMVYDKTFWGIAPLVPWFAWCMLPLTLSNVLIGNLLARKRYEAVPWLVLVAGSYGVTLAWLAPDFQLAGEMGGFRMVIQTLGVFSTLLLAVATWFTWRPARVTVS